MAWHPSASNSSISNCKPVAKWVNAGHGWVPSNRSLQALIGGYDVNGEHLFIGRSNHEGHLIPGKINQSHGVCYVPLSGKEHAKDNYQVLAQIIDQTDIEFEWIHSENGSVPSKAIQGGVTDAGEPLYIGRVEHENSLVIGKIHPSNHALYIAFAGGEHAYRNYECLCIK